MSKTDKKIIPVEQLVFSYGYVYRFTNLVNGKMYHGQTIKEEGMREQEHLSAVKRGSQLYFHRALRKYGRENFKNEILCYCGNALSLALAEDLCINLFSLSPQGYNLRRGGVHGKLTKEVKEKLSKTQKERWNDPEYKEKQSEIQKEVWNRTGFRKKQSEIQKEVWNDPEKRKKQSEKMKEIHNRPEMREKNSKASKEVWNRPEMREKLSEKMKEIWNDPEMREKLSEKMKEIWNDPEMREKLSEIYNNPEYKEKLSEKMKEVWNRTGFREKQSKSQKETAKERAKIKKKCQYCEKEFSVLGLGMHEKACKEKYKEEIK